MSPVVHPDAVVVELPQRPAFSHENAEALKLALYQAGRQGRLVLDCSRVEAVCATFVAVLIVTMKRLGARPGDVVLCNVQPVPLLVLQITRVDRLFPIHPSRTEALQSICPADEPYIVAGPVGPDHIVG